MLLRLFRYHMEMLTRCDTETGVEVVDDGKENRVRVGAHPVRRHEAHHRDDDDKEGVEPVDVAVEVSPRHRLLRDVRLLEVLGAGPQRSIVGRAIRHGRQGRRRRRRGSHRVGLSRRIEAKRYARVRVCVLVNVLFCSSPSLSTKRVIERGGCNEYKKKNETRW